MWLLRYHLVNYVWCEALTFFAILSNGTQLLQKGPHHHRLLHLPGQKLYYGSGSEESCQDVKEALTWNSPQLSWFAHTIVKGGVSIEIQQCPSVLCNTNVSDYELAFFSPASSSQSGLARQVKKGGNMPPNHRGQHLHLHLIVLPHLKPTKLSHFNIQ